MIARPDNGMIADCLDEMADPLEAQDGEHALLPVPAAEITWDGTAWQVSNQTFDTAGAMRLANKLNWFHAGLGSVPFPPPRG